jgi:hypothetical protein
LLARLACHPLRLGFLLPHTIYMSTRFKEYLYDMQRRMCPGF